MNGDVTRATIAGRVTSEDGVEIRRLDASEAHTLLDSLATVLSDCVAGGASVSYLAPFSHEDGRHAFEGMIAEVEGGRRLLLAAFAKGELVGTVQVILALPPNHPHRGDRQTTRPPSRPQAWHCATAHGARRG